MPLDLSNEGLNAQIDALGQGFAAHAQRVRERNEAYLRAYSPLFANSLKEHDQWADPLRAGDDGHFRSSFNITRGVVDLWTGLEAPEFPAIRWIDEDVPAPVPSLDELEQQQRQSTYRSSRLVVQHVSTMREAAVRQQVRRSKLKIHHFRATRKKNLYGHSWLKLVPDRKRKTFRAISKIDPATVFPVWSAWDDRKLDALLVVTRKSARTMNRAYPEAVKLDRDGQGAEDQGYYTPSSTPQDEIDRRYVWVEDYWVLDEEYAEEVADEAEPVESMVVNCIRVNGKIVQKVEYPGWPRIPYFLYENEDERGDHLGFSDAGTALPVQDGLNRLLSQQGDVIHGESRPRFKYRGDSQREITLDPEGEEVIALDQDEDIEQLQVRLDVFPTQVHGTQLFDVLTRATGLNDSVWGRIVASQNSGRALTQAWRSVAARMVGRIYGLDESVTDIVTFMVDLMVLYDWSGAKALYGDNREFEPDFPNQEPRDFLEVTTDAINKYNAGAIDQVGMMELMGEQSPDEMQERVRADNMDPVTHPEKALSYLMLQRTKQQIAIEAQQAGLQVQQYLAQLAAMPPGGAPAGGTGGMSPEQQMGAARAASSQAAAQSAPQLVEGQNTVPMPATAAGAPGNQTKFSTMTQDGGPAMTRIISQGVIP